MTNPLKFDPKREERIRTRAYHLWESEGRPHGRAAEFWERAAELVLMEEAGVTGQLPNPQVASGQAPRTPHHRRGGHPGESWRISRPAEGSKRCGADTARPKGPQKGQGDRRADRLRRRPHGSGGVPAVTLLHRCAQAGKHRGRAGYLREIASGTGACQETQPLRHGHGRDRQAVRGESRRRGARPRLFPPAPDPAGPP